MGGDSLWKVAFSRDGEATREEVMDIVFYLR